MFAAMLFPLTSNNIQVSGPGNTKLSPWNSVKMNHFLNKQHTKMYMDIPRTGFNCANFAGTTRGVQFLTSVGKQNGCGQTTGSLSSNVPVTSQTHALETDDFCCCSSSASSYFPLQMSWCGTLLSHGVAKWLFPVSVLDICDDEQHPTSSQELPLSLSLSQPFYLSQASVKRDKRNRSVVHFWADFLFCVQVVDLLVSMFYPPLLPFFFKKRQAISQSCQTSPYLF